MKNIHFTGGDDLGCLCCPPPLRSVFCRISVAHPKRVVGLSRKIECVCERMYLRARAFVCVLQRGNTERVDAVTDC